jgi:hypothetical protein
LQLKKWLLAMREKKKKEKKFFVILNIFSSVFCVFCVGVGETNLHYCVLAKHESKKENEE